MLWTIKAIYEDDFGCEERPDDWEPQILLLLENAEGEKKWLRISERQAKEQGLAENGTILLEDA